MTTILLGFIFIFPCISYVLSNRTNISAASFIYLPSHSLKALDFPALLIITDYSLEVVIILIIRKAVPYDTTLP